MSVAVLERVTSAILAEHSKFFGGLPREYAERLARVAVQSMREPSEAMVDEGFQHTGDPCWPDNVKIAWRAMIDTALKD